MGDAAAPGRPAALLRVERACTADCVELQAGAGERDDEHSVGRVGPAVVAFAEGGVPGAADRPLHDRHGHCGSSSGREIVPRQSPSRQAMSEVPWFGSSTAVTATAAAPRGREIGPAESGHALVQLRGLVPVGLSRGTTHAFSLGSGGSAAELSPTSLPRLPTRTRSARPSHQGLEAPDRLWPCSPPIDTARGVGPQPSAVLARGPRLQQRVWAAAKRPRGYWTPRPWAGVARPGPVAASGPYKTRAGKCGHIERSRRARAGAQRLTSSRARAPRVTPDLESFR